MLATVLGSFILYFGRTLFIPLSFALLISFLLYPICTFFEKKGVNKSISILFAISILFLLVALLFYALITQVSIFLQDWDVLKIEISRSLLKLTNYLEVKFDIRIDDVSQFSKKIIDGSGSQIISFLINTISTSAFFIIIIPVFSVLILHYRKMLTKALYSIFTEEKKGIIGAILSETIVSYHNFIKGMLLVYLIVGLLNSIGLLALGIPHPFLFGFIASILTFIPYIGILVSSLLPISISWITYNSIWYPIGIILIFAVVQLLEANIIFPYIVGNRLKINTFSIIVVMIFGGVIWGAAGMILFIPFICIVKLIADRSDNLRAISLLLSSDDNLQS